MSPVTHLTEPLRFLIVDDSRAIQAIVRRTISQCGYEPLEFQTASSGAEGLEALKHYKPDLVVTDWHMPAMSGLEMVQAMRQMGLHHLRVGFVTTERSTELLDQAIRNGAMFIIHKPFDDAELLAVVAATVKDLVAAKATPAHPHPVAAPAEVVSTPALQLPLTATLGKIPYRLIPNERMHSDKLTPTLLLGLYSLSGRKGVHAVGVMDAHAVCMVGGGALLKLPQEIRQTMTMEQPPELLIQQAHKFLGLCSACLAPSVPEGAGTVGLAKASVVQRNFSKLTEVLAQTHNRSDFRIAIPGYGEGRMAFFLIGTPP
ncbi:MAG: response regulator [Rhodoferax sp.]